ncbi:MAG: hypothetical protein WC898_02390 [Candidatus Paceibacterota bacterium]|jgi:hypothetical protein
MKFLQRIPLCLLLSMIIATAAWSATDSLGIVGKFIVNKLQPHGITPAAVAGLMSFLISSCYGAFRALQRYLQGRKTIWKYADNSLTTSLFNRLIGWVFGKTTLIYGSELQYHPGDRDAAVTAAAKLTAEHMLRKNGSDMLKAFAEAAGK